MYKTTKRLLDIICAIVGIIGTSPIWLIAAVGTYISDPGPIFYCANRVGRGNRHFRMFKFRTMRIDKNADEKSLRADENRIFAFGALMRRLKIDELPQLLNILNGTMSIIGPRPASSDQVNIVRAGKFSVVSTVPCGLSGPSALYDYIYGDEITDEDEYMKKVLPTRLDLDAYYVGKASLSYDIKMVWYTIVCIIYSIMGKVPTSILNELLESARNYNKKK